MKRKETYLSRDFRETVALRFPAQAKELNTAFDMRLSALLAENADASKEKQCHLKRQILPGIASVALTGSVLLVQGSIDVLTLFLFLMAASRMYDPMHGALQNLAAVIAMRTNVGRMNEILDAPLQTGSEQLTNQGCDIVFDHVGFAYNSGETVLRDVSFTAKKGEVTALVGPSGGKTTVSRLAARFWDYQKGSITVGGMEVSQIDPEKLMSLYSIVFQDVTLFDNTILENIRLGRKGATDEEVLAAAKLANCDEFAEKLRTSGTRTSARMAALFPAASVSAFPSPVLF